MRFMQMRESPSASLDDSTAPTADRSGRRSVAFGVARRELTRVWLAVTIALVAATYWLLAHLAGPIANWLRPYTARQLTRWLAELMYLWLLALLWLANRRWREALLQERELEMAIASVGPHVLLTVIPESACHP